MADVTIRHRGSSASLNKAEFVFNTEGGRIAVELDGETVVIRGEWNLTIRPQASNVATVSTEVPST